MGNNTTYLWFKEAMSHNQTNLVNINLRRVPDDVMGTIDLTKKSSKRQLAHTATMLAILRKAIMTRNHKAHMPEAELIEKVHCFFLLWHIEQMRRKGLLEYAGGNPLDPNAHIKIKLGDRTIRSIYAFEKEVSQQ